jgi:hypothetical protein
VVEAQRVLADGPTVTTQTPLADLRTLVADLGEANAAIATAAETVTGVDAAGVGDAFDTLEGVVENLTGTQVGNAAATVNPLIRDVRTAHTELSAAAGCE